MGSEVNLKPIIDKLGHTLEEIRVRSLKNILSKLEHNLLCDADLVQEKGLQIRLLEWFNFPSCPLQEKVLGLIHRLSKHSSAAGIILDVGGVEFMTQLRPNVNGDLHSVVDGILDNLFHLPLSQHESHTNECIYKQHDHHTHAVTTHHHTSASHQDGVPSHYLQPSDTFSELLSNTTTTSQGGTPMQRFASPPSEPQRGYFDCSQEEARQPVYVPHTIPAAAAYCFKFSTFPWIALTPTDRHVLSSTDSSLKGNDRTLVMSACEFLSDVVFEDFPAEIFLQRPSILKSLLSLLNVPSEGPSNVALFAVRTLQDLAKALETRIYFYQDPALYTPKQDFSQTGGGASSSSSSFLSQSLASNDSRPSVVGHSDMRHRGDGQDGDNSGQSSGADGAGGIEQTDIEQTHSLQFMQWTTPQFCMAVLEKLLPCMKSPDEEFILHGVALLHQVTALLRESVTTSALWDDISAPAKELVEQFHSSLEMLGDTLYLHYHGNLSPVTPDAELSQHRVAFMGLAVFIMHYVTTMLPKERASQMLPAGFTEVLALIAQDEGLAQSLPDVRASCIEYLQLVNFDAYELLMLGQQVGLSLQNTCAFLMESDEPTDENILELIEDAESGLHSLPYHLSHQYIQRCVQLASLISRKVTPNPAAVKKSRQILLKLLAHPILTVKQQTYAAANEIVKDSLGINHVTDPTSSATQGVVFLIDQQVLYEICCFGLGDKDPKVKESADEIMLYLLQSQLLLPSARWHQLLEAVTVVMPFLQSFASSVTGLGKAILGLLATDSEIQTGCLPTLERFRATLRLMYSADNRLRSEGLGRLTWFLAHESESLRKLPLFTDLDLTSLSSLLIIEMPRSLLDEDTSRSVFQSEGMRKVYEIFASDRVEPDVRRSAAEQLAIMIQDPALQPLFLEKGGLDYIIQLIVIAVKKQEDEELAVDTRLLPPMVKMLRAIVQHNYGLRHKLAHVDTLYYAALRCALLLSKDFNLRQEVSELLAFLLFDEVAMATSPDDDTLSELNFGFSMPATLVKKYKLPFKPPSHHASSPHRVEVPPESDPLTRGVMAELLRVTWCSAWHNGVEEAIKQAGRGGDETRELFSPKLKLTKRDKVILQTSHIKSGLEKCVHMIENATSHTMVSDAVLRMASYVVLAAKHDISDTTHALIWREAIHRFMLIIPSSSADETLLRQILQFLCVLLSANERSRSPEVLTWICNVLHDHQGALLGLLSRTEAASDDVTQGIVIARRQLNRTLLKFVKVYVASNKYSLVDKKTFECVRGDLTKQLLSRINRTDAAHFYNLASLESTLLCLVHVTARPGWSTQCVDMDSLALCLKLLHSLLEVVSAFHVGRGGISMSYMGRGVTRCAAICLRHLAYEMSTQLQSKEWPRNWLFSRQATADSVGESGFHWLIPLWSYRDTEVRAAGLGIAAALTSTESGRITMATQCQHIPGGVWGTAFNILLDQTECSLVRQQAAQLLTNMTSQAMPSGSGESSADVWQGPIVRNEQTQESLVGLPALLALLHHSSFYQEMLTLLSNYYPQPAIQPISVPAEPKQPITAQHHSSLSTSSSTTPRSTRGTPSSAVRTSTPASQDRPATLGQPGNDASFIPSAPVDGGVTGAGGGSTPAGARSASVLSHASNTPASVIGSHGGTNSSNATTCDTTVTPYQSVASPGLVSAVTHLLHNLVALATEHTLSNVLSENIHKVLLSLLDVSLLDAYISDLVHTPYRARYLLSFRGVLRLYTQVLVFLRACMTRDETVRNHVMQDSAALKQIVKLLAISYPDDKDTAAQCERMWEAGLSLYTHLFKLNGHVMYEASVAVLVKHWSTVAARVVTILQDTKQADSALWIATLNFVSASLSEEGRVRSKGVVEGEGIYYIVHRLDAPNTADSGELFPGCGGGAVLCETLIRVLDAVLLKPMEAHATAKTCVYQALKSLLAISHTAKMAALEGGLVETLTEHLKQLTHKITMDSLDAIKVLNKKKGNLNVTEMMLLLDLLRNFMLHENKVKLAAHGCGLSMLIHKCWSFCECEPALMSCMLSLLCTYTARCPQACSSLAFTHALSVQDKPSDSKPQHSPHSLVHCLVKLVPREISNNNVPHLRSCFALLATLALSQECRGILWKSNFLHEFGTLTPKKPKKSKLARVLESLWLDLLVNLSFCTEGQNMILKIKDVLNLLLEFGASSVAHNQSCALLILRNLCFHASNKPVVLANNKVVPFMLECLENGSVHTKAVVCSALLALLANNQKAKVALRSNQVIKRLQDAHNSVASDACDVMAQKCVEHIEDILIQLTAS